MTDEPLKWTDAKSIAGMKPWACSYLKNGGRYSITLMGVDAKQVLNDNCDLLNGLKVDGELVCTAPVIPTRNEGD